MRAVLEEVLAREPDAVIPWTGRHMAVAKFVPHLRMSLPFTAGISSAMTRSAPSCSLSPS
jgi:hypothetical protein